MPCKHPCSATPDPACPGDQATRKGHQTRRLHCVKSRPKPQKCRQHHHTAPLEHLTPWNPLPPISTSSSQAQTGTFPPPPPPPPPPPTLPHPPPTSPPPP